MYVCTYSNAPGVVVISCGITHTYIYITYM